MRTYIEEWADSNFFVLGNGHSAPDEFASRATSRSASKPSAKNRVSYAELLRLKGLDTLPVGRRTLP
ncbi:hypothetical protein I6N90_22090 [Paenibacillus sp. GSMTC-2017]|uniref:hypothetical protein n=1 Tax=Paenibacillus sp. GSMTC-2017 TaxID=2794350 RepID=UPI0018D83711|nr:hypothetical protein [Paenibacillus sp. GSMTC-2017]MBH5320488.1 hypothetical protein [Paenibacillus sp. GSMTC-2017]